MEAMHESLGALALMWAVMMAVMMAPAAAPSWLVHSRMSGSRVASGAYLAGYLGAWAAAGLAYAGAHWLLQESGWLDGEMRLASARAAGVVLVAAGAWQWTSTKAACVAKCRSPLGFMMSDWREGIAGAFAMGLRYAAWCVGCCWLVMAVLFVAGAMSIAWAIAISLYVLLERLLPLGRRFDRAMGAALVALGLWRLVVPV
jgi:predicted metal-binding membrane protein